MRTPRSLVSLGRCWLGSVRCQVSGARLLGTQATQPGQENIVKSPFPIIDIPKISLDELVWRNLDRWSKKTAVVCAQTGRKYSYAKLRSQCERVAQGLRTKAGLNRGDVIAIIAPNVPEYCLAVLGALKAGIVVTTVNPIYTPDEIAKQLKDSGAKAVVTLSMLHPAVDIARKSLPESQRDIPIFTIKHLDTDVTPEGAIDFGELREYRGPLIHLGHSEISDLAFLPYSSGTTGLPKGVQLTHHNVVANLTQIRYDEIRLNVETTENWQDKVSAVLPMYHIYGLVLVFLSAISEGCQIITMPKFTPDGYHRMILEHRPTMLYTAPPIVLFLNNFPGFESKHLECVRRLMCGAAPLAASDIERFKQKFQVKNTKVLQGYGLTESSPLTHTQIADVDNSQGGIGWPIPNTECRIISLDDDKTDLGVEATGQLAVRGPQVMKGYHNNEEATRETVDDEGWLRTGDIAHYTADGQFHITDRLKELIKVKGFQVAPAELEGLLRNHPSILDAAVTGVDHPKQGQIPKAFVVLRSDAPIPSETDLQEFIASKVAPFKKLTGGVAFVQSIPKNPSGKILRRLLKDL